MTCHKLWSCTGVKNKRRYIPIHDIVSAMGPEVCKALHVLTGYDSTSALSGIRKKTAFRKLLKAEDHLRNIVELGDTIPPTENTVHACEKYVCSLSVECTPLPMLQETQHMMSVIGCSARSGKKVNACHLHQTAFTCTSNEQIASPSIGNSHFMPSKHCQSQMGMDGWLQMMVLSLCLSP